MNDQEREVISDIFRRLEQVANQPRDPEAERFIAEKLRQQPYAPYAMAQAVYVQEQALANLQAENEQLRAELDQTSRQPRQGGFLSGLFGGGSNPPGPAYNAPPARQASPWGSAGPQSMRQQPHGIPQAGMPGPWGGTMQPRGGGGFLQGALSTAAGVAGGMMIANALSHAFSGDQPGAADTQTAAADQAGADQGEDFADFGGDGGDEGDWA